MPIVHLKTRFQPTVSANLDTHVFADFVPRSAAPYIGATKPISLRRTSVSMTGAIRWDQDMQGMAVSRGFFLHRSGYLNRVNIINVHQAVPEAAFDSFDGYAALDWLLQQYSRNEFHSNNHDAHATREMALYAHALAFIEQQDKFGYLGAWERRVQFYSRKLTWYKAHHAALNPTRPTPHAKAVLHAAQMRAEASKKAQGWAYAARMRHWLRVGDDGVARPVPHGKHKPAPIQPKRGRPRTTDSATQRWPGQQTSAIIEPVKPVVKSHIPLASTFRKPVKANTDPVD